MDSMSLHCAIRLLNPTVIWKQYKKGKGDATMPKCVNKLLNLYSVLMLSFLSDAWACLDMPVNLL